MQVESLDQNSWVEAAWGALHSERKEETSLGPKMGVKAFML